VVADPTIHCSHEPILHRPLDIAEQDDSSLIGRILGAVNEGLVEYETLSVAKHIRRIDQDSAFVRIGSYQPR